jgi:protein disulfide-isomerase
MQLKTIALALGLALATAGCKQAATPPASTQAHEIAWREGDVDDALAEAKEAGKPVLLYWGAVWCPPCNQMKTTLFKDPGFIAETQHFVPVYLDGDSKGAQQWGERFGISGYPTVIVLKPDGTEITRISSSTMASKLPDLLQAAARSTTSIEELLAKAEKGTRGLTADEWQILAGFDWRNDPKHFKDLAKAGTLLESFAKSAPDPAMRRRFGLLALVVAADQSSGDTVELSKAQQRQLASILPAILGDPGEVMANRQELIGDAADLVIALPKGKQRDEISQSLLAAMDTLYADTSLSVTERLDTIYPAIALAKADGGKVSPELLAKVHERVDWADANAKDSMTRQAALPDGAYFLEQAGDAKAAMALLEGNLKTSKAPYYYMLDLASIAEDQGDKDAAIDWARKAYETAQGPATRVQWAVDYAGTVMRLEPENKHAVEASAAAVIDELAKSPDSYYQRTRVKVTRWGNKLREWAEKNKASDVLERLRTEMARVCAKEGDEAETCNQWSREA